MYDAEERLRRAQIERRIVETLATRYKVFHTVTNDTTLLPNWARMRNRSKELQKEIAMLKAWIAERGFKGLRG